MKKRKTLKAKISYRIRRSRGSVFVFDDFKDLAGRPQVSRALRELVLEGLIYRLGYGLYARARISRISGKILPEKSLPELGIESMKKLKIKIGVPSLEKSYLEGKSTQVPTGRMIRVVKSRVSRKIGYNGNYISYERASR